MGEAGRSQRAYDRQAQTLFLTGGSSTASEQCGLTRVLYLLSAQSLCQPRNLFDLGACGQRRTRAQVTGRGTLTRKAPGFSDLARTA